jgi:hypothetical protein
MKNIFFILLYLFCAHKINAQWLELGNISSNDNYERINSIHCDQSGYIYALRTFTSNSTSFSIPKWDGNSWLQMPTLVSAGLNHETLDASSDSQYLYVVGDFIDNTGVYNLIRWDGNSWSNLGNPIPSIKPYLYLVCNDKNGNIFVYGQDTQAGQYLARYNSNGWVSLPLPTGVGPATGGIASICTDALGNLYAAGRFTNSSGNCYVAKWNGISWSELGGQNNLGANNSIFSIHFDNDGGLFAGGSFSNANNEIYVAKWDGTNWNELPGLTQAKTSEQRIVFDITSDQDGNVYVGGSLESLNSGNFFIGKWNGSKWVEINTNIGTYTPFITSLCTDPAGNLYATGDFKNSSGKRFVAMFPNAKSVGIKELVSKNNTFSIFPNPTSEKIRIETSDLEMTEKVFKVNVRNIIGQIICNRTISLPNNSLDLTELSAGIYFITVNIDDHWLTQRLVKE